MKTYGLLPVFLLACGPQTVVDGGDDEGEGSPVAVTTTPRPWGDAEEDTGDELDDCGVVLCAFNVYDSGLDDPEHLTCALEAMRDGAQGRVEARLETGDSPQSIEVAVADDRSISRLDHGIDNGVGGWSTPLDCTLRPPAYFDACIEAEDPSCRDPENWFTECTFAAAFYCPG